jgi:hypothetical protein
LGIKRPPAAPPDPYPVEVSGTGRTFLVTCELLGISEWFTGSWTAANEFGKRLVNAHLKDHGPVKVGRPAEPYDPAEVFGRW